MKKVLNLILMIALVTGLAAGCTSDQSTSPVVENSQDTSGKSMSSTPDNTAFDLNKANLYNVLPITSYS